MEGSEGGGAGRRRGREDDDGPSEEAGEAEAEPPAKVPRSPPYGHIVAFCAIYGRSTMAQTGVSGLVVVDGESFLDALFASAGQG